MKYLKITVATIGLAFLALGCSGDPAKPNDEGDLNITMADFEFTPDKIDIEAGRTIRFTLRNESTEHDHGFTIGENVTRHGGSANGYEKDFFEGVEVKVIGPAKLVNAGGALLTREGGGAVEDTDGSG